MLLPKTFNRGSEWLRWDPHLHAPGTLLEDRFRGDWDGFFKAIEAATPAVAALGITDYMGIGCYEQFLSMRGGHAPGVKLVFPNIEFRLAPFTNDNKAINAHLLISPDDAEHITKIKFALGNLHFDADGGPYPCNTDGLRALGRRNGGRLDEAAALHHGAMLYVLPFETFREWLEKHDWLRKNSIVVCDGTGDDGISGVRGARWAALREDICRFTDALFTSNERDREFWLGMKDPAEVARLNGPKPCLHGSDAHSVKRTCKPDNNRYTWIRANATFDGLRQTLYEPTDRVWIGDRRPDERDNHLIASDVHFSQSEHWLKTDSVPLNPGLVAIIGPRGSGKTALADSIAAAAGAGEDGTASFLAKAAEQLGDSTVTLRWADGSEAEPALLRQAPCSGSPAVRYLSQQFVETLCSEDKRLEDEPFAEPGRTNRLLDEIESVIFSGLEESESNVLFASNFIELRESKCERFDAAVRELQEEMADLTRKIHKVLASHDQQPARRAALNKLGGEITTLEQYAAKLVGTENPATLREMQGLQAKKAELQAKIAAMRAQDQDLENLAADYIRWNREVSNFYLEAKRRLILAGATESDVLFLQLCFGGDAQALISRLRTTLQKNAEAFVGTGTPAQQGTVAQLQQRIDELQKGISADAARKRQLADTNKSIGVKKAEVGRLEREATEADNDLKRLPDLVSRRFDAYLEVFDNLQRKKEALSALYAPLRAHLDARGQTAEREIDFFVRPRIRLSAWARQGEALLDGRKCQIDIAERSKELIWLPWRDGDRARLSAGIRQFYEEFKDAKNYLRAGATPQQFGEWLFSTEHVALQYGLRFDGTDLEHLSPGAKGVALLLLYLSIDTSDQRPLIIDQPEENLDPKSVYDILVPHIKRARRHRQVIIVTHNPNLVVNTDADQVIVADSVRLETGKLPEISYASGALEDEAIRRIVCDILEGGEEAFRQREHRYRLLNPDRGGP